jgi:predicted MFS family arabinose efflux permease
MAYIADITTPEDRSKGIGLMGAAMGAGIIVGPGLGGIVGHYSLAMPFFVAGGLAFLTLPWAYFLLPESKSSHDRSAPGDNQGLSLAMLRHPQFPLFAATLVVSFTMAMFEGTFALFAADRVGFGPRDMGVLFTIIGVLGVVVQSCLLWRIINLFGDAAVITGSLLISAVGLFCMMQSTSVFSLWIYTAIFSVGNTCLRPSLSTLISKTSSTGQGASMGVMQSFDSLGRIAGPVFGGWTYGLSRNSPFFIAACMLVSTLLFLRARLILYEKMANSEAQSSQSIQEA